MAIYLGENKLTGTGIQVDDAISSSSTNPVQNKVVAEALSDVGYSEWKKPADWMDIRSGAIDGSIYFLVGHSADYSSYPTFSVKARVSNSGTYDVYVDGIKQATSNDNTTTTLNWQTLALTSGWDVTYPQALRTHIVRITPTVSTNNFTSINGYDVATTVVANGLLWAHFTTSEKLNVAFGSTTGTHAPLLESITTDKNDELNVNILANFITNLPSIKHLPTINCDGVGFRPTYAFYSCSSPIKKLRLKKCKQTAQWDGPFTNFSQVEEILADDCLLFAQDNTFRGMENLKHLPSCIDYSRATRIRNFLMSDTKLENTVIDVSQNTTLTELSIGGSSSARIDGLKGLTVSPEAPFNGTSPQINVSYTGLDRNALVNLFKSMPYNVGYTVVGSPTITDGMASGFGASNYLQIEQTYNATNDKNVEIYVRAKTPTTISSSFNPILGADNIGFWGISSYTNALFAIRMGYSNGTSLTFGDMYISGGIQADTWYRFKITGSNGIWRAEIYNDGGTLLNSADRDWTSNTLSADYTIKLKCTDNTNTYSGSIDLNNTYIKINGVPWFTGKAAMTKTCSVVGCTGTADLTQDDKNIVLNKGWELTVA